MLSYEKVLCLKRLLDIIFYMYKNKIHSEYEKFGFRIESHNRMYNETTFSVIMRCMKDEWFAIAIHPTDDKVQGKYEYTGKQSFNKNNQLICAYVGNAQNIGIDCDKKTLVLEGLDYNAELESSMFQLQTAHNDRETLMVVLEYLVRSCIDINMYVPINIDKLLSISTEDLENICTLWENYIDNYEECNANLSNDN